VLPELIGKTLMTSTEQASPKLLRSDLFNRMISGESVMVEKKFCDPYSFTPHAKFLFAMTEHPQLSEAGNGFFRRLAVVPFPARPIGDRDPAVKEKIKTESAGILNWALEGGDRLRMRGRFDLPSCVLAATKEMQAISDAIGAFLEDWCVIKADTEIQSKRLYAAYKAWCKENSHQPKSSTAMAPEWTQRGFCRRRINGRTFWTGLDLAPRFGETSTTSD
jgi:putative DNA primase/helicase